MLKLSLATWCEELTYLKRPWCWERLKAGGEGGNRAWDGWMASPTQWAWVWAILGVGGGQGGLGCCSPWVCRESGLPERLTCTRVPTPSCFQLCHLSAHLRAFAAALHSTLLGIHSPQIITKLLAFLSFQNRLVHALLRVVDIPHPPALSTVNLLSISLPAFTPNREDLVYLFKSLFIVCLPSTWLWAPWRLGTLAPSGTQALSTGW